MLILATVPAWNNAYVRGICILPKGLDYNASYYHVKEADIIENLKEKVLRQNKEILELRGQSGMLEIVETEQEKEERQLEEVLEKESEIDYESFGFKDLVETITEEFGKTFEPICNGVKGWQKEVKFYINSYKKLAVEVPNGQVVQLKDPVEISNFWKYLEQNRGQIGKVIDFSRALDIEELNSRYKGLAIFLKDEKFTVYEIKKAENGLHICIKNSGTKKIARLTKNGESIVFGLEECEKVLLGLRDLHQ